MQLEATQALEAALAEDDAPDAPDNGANSSPESPDSTDTNVSLETADIDTLLRALDQQQTSGHKPDAPATEQPPAANAAPEEAAPAAPETTEEEDDDAAPETVPTTTARNFRLHTDDPKLASFLKTLKSVQAANPKVNPVEVAALVGYSLPGALAPAAQAAPSEPAPPDPRVEALRAEIAQLEADITHKRTVTYENVEADADFRKLVKKERELERVEEAIAAQAIADAEFEAGEQAALDEAFRLAPETGQEDTDQHDAIVAERERVKRSNPEVLKRPDYPLVLLRLAAERKPALFPKVVQKAAGTAAPALVARPVAKPGQPTSRPVGVVAQGNRPGPTLDASNAEAAMGQLTPAQLIDALNRAAEIERGRKKK